MALSGGPLDRSITLAVDVEGDATDIFRIVSTSEGQRAFWTADCEVGADRARFARWSRSIGAAGSAG